MKNFEIKQTKFTDYLLCIGSVCALIGIVLLFLVASSYEKSDVFCWKIAIPGGIFSLIGVGLVNYSENRNDQMIEESRRKSQKVNSPGCPSVRSKILCIRNESSRLKYLTLGDYLFYLRALRLVCEIFAFTGFGLIVISLVQRSFYPAVVGIILEAGALFFNERSKKLEREEKQKVREIRRALRNLPQPKR